MNTVLIGPRACGKTTIGRLLAQRIRRPFIDLDGAVLERLGQRSVAEAWSTHGEPAWRQAETAALQDALKADESVIALGGGTPMIAAARVIIEAARSTGAVRIIYLRCLPDRLVQRLKSQPGDRPSLTGVDPATEIMAIAAERHPTYQGLADWVCETGQFSAEAIVDQIEKQFFRSPEPGK